MALRANKHNKKRKIGHPYKPKNSAVISLEIVRYSAHTILTSAGKNYFFINWGKKTSYQKACFYPFYYKFRIFSRNSVARNSAQLFSNCVQVKSSCVGKPGNSFLNISINPNSAFFAKISNFWGKIIFERVKDFSRKELSFCLKLKFSNPYFFGT